MSDVLVITQAEMVTNIRALLNEPVALGISDDDIKMFLDDAVVDLSTKTNLARTRDTFITLAGSATYASSQSEYLVSADAALAVSGYKIASVMYLGTTITADDGVDVGFGTARGLAKIHPRMVAHLPSTLGIPIYWYYTTSIVGASSADVVGIWPKPAAAQTSQLLRVLYYEYLPGYLDTGQDDNTVPDWAQDVLMWYTYAKCLEREGRFAQAEQYMSYYNNIAMFMRNDITNPDIDSKDMMVQPDYTRVVQ